jgi:hypothetical protein
MMGLVPGRRRTISNASELCDSVSSWPAFGVERVIRREQTNAGLVELFPTQSPGQEVLAYTNKLLSHPGSRSSSEAAGPLDDDTLVVEPDQGNGLSRRDAGTW